MKKKFLMSTMYLTIIFSTLIILSIVVGPFFHWSSMPAESLKVWILDKTVPQEDYREHKGLMWVLNHLKFFKEDKQPFKYSEDYFGFVPGDGENYSLREFPRDKVNPDLIYITDTYGVYTDDLKYKEVSSNISDLVYGGLQSDEIDSVKRNLGNGNTIIGEFNIASAPTNVKNRKELEKIFAVRWKGWKGRYFKDLSRKGEVNDVIIGNYEKQYNKRWDFNGWGVVLISDEEKILVLEGEKHLGNKAVSIIFNGGYSKEFAINKEIPYYYWFEIAQGDPDVESIASYKIDLTEEGAKIFEENNISKTFPAVMRFKNSQYIAYYFAGDFADLKNVSRFWAYSGLAEIKKFFTRPEKGEQEYFYWNCYVPMMKKIMGDIKERRDKILSADSNNDILKLVSKTNEIGFEIYKDNKWQELFIKGVNIGAAFPGKWFTEFPEDKRTYLHWFKLIGDMNANTIRTYTLLPPEFYSALKYYNEVNKNKTIYLFQEIWPEENPNNGNYLDKAYEEEYKKEIEFGIDAIHGNANIPARRGRAYGMYTADISDYVLGYLIGRELEPKEVKSTNELNKGYSYKGEYLSSEMQASPTEAWLAMNCDYAMKYENQKYNMQHPVAIVNWPTLDPIEHDSEWNAEGKKELEFNDSQSVNINNIKREVGNKAGFFGAYHIYPNYPDFMNNEPSYNSYTDEEGRFRYGGYLKEFISGHKKYPALVAEFGLATGMGNAHTNPDGYNHGGMTEEEQGHGIVRMMKAIKKEGYAGGIIFQWMDEWAKKTWITEPFMIPYDRHAFWRNVIDPEQNYGILAMETKKPDKAEYNIKGNGEIKTVEMSKDEAFLYVDITFNNSFEFNNKKLLIGLDTYDRSKGEFKYSKDVETNSKSGMEFMIEINGKDNSRLLVHPGYNIYSSKYSSYNSSNGVFEEVKSVINKERVTKDGTIIPQHMQDGSRLIYGDFKDNTHNYWYIEGSKIQIRIPWLRLNFSDPSSMTVINDDRKIDNPIKDQLNTVVSEGIIPSAILINTEYNKVVAEINTSQLDAEAFAWESWNQPKFVERLKKSYNIISKYFKD